jgi:hypothetical protein
MRKITRSIIHSSLLSFSILIFGAQCDVADAQGHSKRTKAAVACGKEIKKQCGGGPVGVPVGVPVGASSVLDCFQKSQKNLSSRCAALANNVFRSCDREAAQLCRRRGFTRQYCRMPDHGQEYGFPTMQCSPRRRGPALIVTASTPVWF